MAAAAAAAVGRRSSGNHGVVVGGGGGGGGPEPAKSRGTKTPRRNKHATRNEPVGLGLKLALRPPQKVTSALRFVRSSLTALLTSGADTRSSCCCCGSVVAPRSAGVTGHAERLLRLLLLLLRFMVLCQGSQIP